MIKKIALLACFTLSFITFTAYADDQLYSSSQQINCLLKDDEPGCDWDSTYLGFEIEPGKSVQDMVGTYHFDHANLFKLGFGDDDDDQIVYFYVNEKGVQADTISVYHILKTDNPAWVPVPGKDDEFTCKSPDIKNCSFTHTPWHENQKNTIKILKATSTTNTKKSSRSWVNTSNLTKVAVDNKTDFPVTVHAGDYNTASFQWITQTVPPHQKITVMQNLSIKDNDRLMFDIQVGPGLRNTDNTSVTYVSTKYSELDDGGLRVDHKEVYVYGAESEDPNTMLMRVDYQEPQNLPKK